MAWRVLTLPSFTGRHDGVITRGAMAAAIAVAPWRDAICMAEIVGCFRFSKKFEGGLGNLINLSQIPLTTNPNYQPLTHNSLLCLFFKKNPLFVSVLSSLRPRFPHHAAIHCRRSSSRPSRRPTHRPSLFSHHCWYVQRVSSFLLLFFSFLPSLLPFFIKNQC
ncbi:hypothetical protein S83_013164 [Arachis hypogaea]